MAVIIVEKKTPDQNGGMWDRGDIYAVFEWLEGESKDAALDRVAAIMIAKMPTLVRDYREYTHYLRFANSLSYFMFYSREDVHWNAV